MKIADQILESKNCEFWPVSPDDTVQYAIGIMADKEVSVLPVLQDHKLIGLFSESDYVRKIIGEGRDPQVTRVAEIMTHEMLTATPTDSIETCMKLMTRGQLRHLPILIGDELVGIVSIHDIVSAMMG
jgi:CBS domain-containing protein